MHPDEIRVMELTQNIKELVFNVDQTRIAAAITDFNQQIATHSAAAIAVLGDSDAFGEDADGTVRSVKPQALRAALLDNLGFDTPTISLKKMNQEKLRQDPVAASALESAAKVNKALSHKRRTKTFAGVVQIDAELTYFAAHTGRFSSRNSGRGLNLHNLPKRNPAVAKPIRSLFRLPDDLCFVRGDFANVEYRVSGLLTNCQHIQELFTRDILADPYSAFWKAATSQTITKKDPARQLAKAAVLGLSYMMGQQRWTDELMRALTEPTFKVSLADLETICATNNWALPADQRTRTILAKLRCPAAVATVAYHTREKFHAVHPELGRAARHIEATVVRAMSLGFDPPQAQRALDTLNLRAITLRDDRTLQAQTVRAVCGYWPAATVSWRDLLVRQTPFGTGPTFVRAGSRPVARFSVNIAIENLVQSAARNALCMGLLELDRRGFPYVLHVHDEVLIVCERTTSAVNAARAALLDVFGPGGWLSRQGWEWSVLINPAEIGVSQSLWEDDTLSEQLWPRIANHDAAALENLP
jgi:hypothetical protein